MDVVFLKTRIDDELQDRYTNGVLKFFKIQYYLHHYHFNLDKLENVYSGYYRYLHLKGYESTVMITRK